MTRISDIRIHGEPSDAESTGNVWSIVAEIRHALERFLGRGETTSIDLRALPFGPGDRDQLLQYLGRGEVSAELRALGTTQVWETAFPGVWVVDHAGPEGRQVALHIEVGPFPSLLCSQREDVQEALERLDRHLSSLGEHEESS